MPSVFDKLICDQHWLTKILNDGYNVTILSVNLEDIEDMEKWVGEAKGPGTGSRIVDVVLIITKNGEIVSCDDNFMPASVLSNAMGRVVSRESRSDERNNPRLVQVKMGTCRINFWLPTRTERPTKVLTMGAGSVDSLRNVHDDVAKRSSSQPRLMYAHANAEGRLLKGPLENMYGREDRDGLVKCSLFSIQYQRLSLPGLENWLYCVPE